MTLKEHAMKALNDSQSLKTTSASASNGRPHSPVAPGNLYLEETALELLGILSTTALLGAGSG